LKASTLFDAFVFSEVNLEKNSRFTELLSRIDHSYETIDIKISKTIVFYPGFSR
jgi:hypothetical protein